MVMRNGILHQRSKRRCLTPNCPNIPTPKEKLCITCQLAGKVVVRRGPKGLEVITTE